jgi:hypothetical protein
MFREIGSAGAASGAWTDDCPGRGLDPGSSALFRGCDDRLNLARSQWIRQPQMALRSVVVYVPSLYRSASRRSYGLLSDLSPNCTG